MFHYSCIKRNFLVSNSCIIYIIQGGMKAVVWTDVFQATVMMAGLLTTAIVGMKEVGSLQSLLDIADSGERLKLE